MKIVDIGSFRRGTKMILVLLYTNQEIYEKAQLTLAKMVGTGMVRTRIRKVDIQFTLVSQRSVSIAKCLR